MSEDNGTSAFTRFFHTITTKKACLMISFVGLCVFFNALLGGFALDDAGLIVYDKDLVQFAPIHYFQKNTYNTSGLYRPLAILYFGVLRQLVGLSPFLYHLIPVAFHIANACMVFMLLRKSLRPKLSLILALIFLVHPMQVESVTYVSGAAGVFCFSFGLLALLIATRKKLRVGDIVCIGVALLLSVLFKESGVQFAALIMLFRFLYYKKSELSLWASGTVSGGIYLLLRFGVGQAVFSNPKNILIQQVSTSIRFSTIPAVGMYYLKTFLFPIDLLIIQNWAIMQRTFGGFYLPLMFELLLVGCLLGLLAKFYKTKYTQWQHFLFYLVWFLGGMSLYLQFFPLDLTVSDRWFYFPMVGVLGLLGVLIQTYFLRSRTSKNLTTFVLIACVLFFAARTVIRNFDWLDALTLYTHDNAAHPSSALENAIAVEYVQRSDLQRAADHFAAAFTLRPNETSAENLAHIALYIGDVEHAKQYFTQVLQIPDATVKVQRDAQLDAVIGLGLIATIQQKPADAQRYILSALEQHQDAGNLWIELASVDSVLGDWKAALDAATKAKELLPGDFTNSLYTKIQSKQPVRLDSRMHLL